MNGPVKPTFKIQLNPKGEWSLTKGGIRYFFKSEEEAIEGMNVWIKNKIRYYDANGKETENV